MLTVLRTKSVQYKRQLCCLMLACIVSSPLLLTAQETDSQLTVSDPAKAGFDPNELANLDKVFADDIDKDQLVGCVALVARGTTIVYCRSFGERDKEKNEAMSDDTIFRIYSMSKPITSVAVMMLVEQGKIDLDDPVSKYIPEFADLKVWTEDGEVDPERAMTVRDLLRHTSGLTYGFFGDTEVDQMYRQAGLLSRNPNLEDFVKKLAEIPLLYQPGTRFHYSVSTDVLGRVVEVASEQTFAAFLSEQIFKPLKMDDTFFTVPDEKQDRFAQMYRRGEQGALSPSNPFQSWRFLNENEFYSGGGGLCSTTGDYLRFCQMMVNGGELDGVRILKAETVKEMTTNQLKGIGRRGFQFGLGVSIDGQGRYGWGGAAGTRFWIDPNEKIVGIFMVQINPYQGENYEQQMKKIVYESLEAKE